MSPSARPLPSSSHDGDGSKPPAKRRRVALACASCRHRKSRCDGRRPICSTCIELECECVYEQAVNATSLTVGRSYIDQLENRLRTIEATLEQVQKVQHASHRDLPPLTQHQSPDNTGSIASYDGSRVTSSLVVVEAAEDAADAMGAMQFTDEEDWAYFGPSSNIAFLRHISLALERSNRDDGSPTRPVGVREVVGGLSVPKQHHSGPNAHDKDTGSGGVNIYVLPAEDHMASMIKDYFAKTGHLLPFIHEESFFQSYHNMKSTNFTTVRRTWLGLLNIIFAMATTLANTPHLPSERRIEESDVFYQRANGLCDKELRKNISIEWLLTRVAVQYMLVLGQYLQGTKKSVQAWTVHGLAITAAFQLGLHSPKTNKRFPSLECEIRNRVWFGCILLDRILALSMTFGRPAIVPQSYVKLNLPSPTVHMVGTRSKSKDTPYLDAMYLIATIKLYEVMYKIIDECYGQNLGLEDSPSESEIVSLVLNRDRDLEDWKLKLTSMQDLSVRSHPLSPQEMENMTQEDTISGRFRMVLSLRYHNLRILLHRSVLERYLGVYRDRTKTGESNGILQRVGIDSIETCIDSAVIIISIVHTIVSLNGWQRDLLGAWNFSLFYTFNAGLVMFAAHHLARDEMKRGQAQDFTRWDFTEKFQPYFNMAIKALQGLDPGNPVVERCVNYLSHLANSIGGTTLKGPSSEVSPNSHRQAEPPPLVASDHSYLQVLGSNQPSGPPSLSIEFDESMLDTDLYLFGNHFDFE
ncbi:fungal-specific transcription factor domain-containing protein [Xylariaceae sp. FL0255]|nr:fungal-specific transcription factor domain-containing protein [Xylariaceae sp. FL0255]